MINMGADHGQLLGLWLRAAGLPLRRFSPAALVSPDGNGGLR
jgi:hypothetical protein